MPPRKNVSKKDAPNPSAPAPETTHQAEETAPVIETHTLTVPLPDQPGACNFIVEFPGYIKNEERALATFGGLNGLAAQRQNHPKTLQLRLRPGDPSCHPLTSDDARTTTVLVLKLTRSHPATMTSTRMQTDDPDSEDDEDSMHDDGVKAEIIAVADKTYAFSAPADFQYAGQDRRPLDVQWVSRVDRVDDDPEFLPRQPLLCTPSIFAVEPAVDYAFKQYKAAEHGLDVLGRKPKRGTGTTWVDYFAKEVPSADTKALGTAADGANNNNNTLPGQGGGQRALAPGIEALITRLEMLFTRRPVYLESALGAALGTLDGVGGGSGGGSSSLAATERGAVTATAGVSSSSFSSSSSFPGTRSQQELLSKLCYRFKNGPWKGTWVLRGYDPRAEPAARQYQVLEYALPVEWWKKVLTYKNRLNKQLQQLQLHSPTTATAGITAFTKVAGGGGGGGSGLSAAPGLPPISPTYTSLCSFSGVQSTQTLQLQLCDIDDSEIRSVLAETSNVAAGVSDASGWLTQPAWEGIKSKVAARFGALWETATAQAANAPTTAGGTSAGGTAVPSGDNIGIIPPELMSELGIYLEKRVHHGKTAGSGGGRSRNTAAVAPTAQVGADEAVAGNVQNGEDNTTVAPIADIEEAMEEEEDEEEEEEEIEVEEDDDEEDDEEEEEDDE